MPSWLVGDPTVLYMLLLALVLVSAMRWWQTRNAKPAGALAIGLGLMAVIWSLNHFIETDVHQIERKVLEMARGVEDRNLERIFLHVSESFFAERMNKAEFRRYAERALQGHNVSSIVIWDFEVRDLSRETRKAIALFKIKAHGIEASQGVAFYNCLAQFVLDPDGQWRMQSFQVFSPLEDPLRGQPLALPGSR